MTIEGLKVTDEQSIEEARIKAEEAYEAVVADLYQTGSSNKGLPGTPHLREPRGLVACLQLAALDKLDQKRLPPIMEESWDGSDPFPRGTANDPEAMVRELNTLRSIWERRQSNKRRVPNESFGKKF